MKTTLLYLVILTALGSCELSIEMPPPIQKVGGLKDFFYPLDSTVYFYKYESHLMNLLKQKDKKTPAPPSYSAFGKVSDSIYSLCNYNSNFVLIDSSLFKVRKDGIYISEYWSVLGKNKKLRSMLINEAPFFKWNTNTISNWSHDIAYLNIKGLPTQETRSLVFDKKSKLKQKFNGQSESIHFTYTEFGEFDFVGISSTATINGSSVYLKGIGLYRHRFPTIKMTEMKVKTLVETQEFHNWTELEAFKKVESSTDTL